MIVIKTLTVVLLGFGLIGQTPPASAARLTGKSDSWSFDRKGRDKREGVVVEIERSVPAKAGETLVLDLDSGASVALHGWDERRVDVRGQLESSRENPQIWSLEREGSRIVLRVRHDEDGDNSWSSNHLSIRVPRRFDVQLQSAGGGLTVQDLEGSLTGTTGGGELEFERVHGRARVSTGGGDIQVTDCDLSGTVSTGGGMVRLSRVRGGLRGSSGSGPVIYADVPGGDGSETADLGDVQVDRSRTTLTRGKARDQSTRSTTGMLHVSKGGGNIRLDEAPGGVDATTGGGDIFIGSANGRVDATTGGGDIDITASGSVRAETGAGEVRVRLVPGRGQRRRVDINSGTGLVVLEVPAGLDLDLELETAYTRESRPSRIRSDIPLEHEPVTDWEGHNGSTPRRYVRAHSKESGGTRVQITTVNGDIQIRRY